MCVNITRSHLVQEGADNVSLFSLASEKQVLAKLVFFSSSSPKLVGDASSARILNNASRFGSVCFEMCYNSTSSCSSDGIRAAILKFSFSRTVAVC